MDANALRLAVIEIGINFLSDPSARVFETRYGASNSQSSNVVLVTKANNDL